MTEGKPIISSQSEQKNTNILSPKYLNIVLLLQFGLHFLFPLQQIIPFPFTLFGFLVIFLGLVMNVWSVKELKTNRTPINFFKPTTKLVVDGPFKISRNPIFLSGVILSLGISVLLGSLISFIFPVALLLILNTYYIPLEEQKLKRTFGKIYLKYKESVRRWI
jgi:protein-S-isoprenylcysteine O-methyltransferase Ste14